MPDRPTRPVSFAQFSRLARHVAESARALGLAAPAFRTPPRLAGADRTLRRAAAGGGAPAGVVVAVRLAERAPAAVVADLVDGVVAANHLDGPDAARVRRALLDAVSEDVPCRAA
jgi:hypothetical protein